MTKGIRALQQNLPSYYDTYTIDFKGKNYKMCARSLMAGLSKMNVGNVKIMFAD